MFIIRKRYGKIYYEIYCEIIFWCIVDIKYLLRSDIRFARVSYILENSHESVNNLSI